MSELERLRAILWEIHLCMEPEARREDWDPDATLVAFREGVESMERRILEFARQETGVPLAAKRKGNNYENSVRKMLESCGLRAARNTQYDQNQKGASDVIADVPGGGPRLVVECKCQVRLPGAAVLSALDQAKQARDEVDGGGIAAAFFHVHGTRREVVVMEWADLQQLLRWGMR